MKNKCFEKCTERGALYMDCQLRVGIISDIHIGFNGHNDPTYFGHFGTIGYYGERQHQFLRNLQKQPIWG